MSILVSSLLTTLDNLLLDVDRVRWTKDERIDYINQGALEVVMRRPAARSEKMVLTLDAGTHQTAPAGTAQVLDILHNVTAAGAADRAIRITDSQQMADADPDWRTNRAGQTKHFTIDERSPTLYEVWPPAVAGAKVMALLAKPPAKVASDADTLDMRAEFYNAIINWAMYRCHTKDSEYSQGAVAGQHYQSFTDAVGNPAMAANQNSATGNDA